MKPVDAEHELARGEGAEATRLELLLALACFFAAMLWSITVGGWIRLTQRVSMYGKSRDKSLEFFEIGQSTDLQSQRRNEV